MTKVAILPEPTERGGPAFRAIAGAHQSLARTAGGALDALTAQLSKEESGTLVIVQNQQPDRFFSAAQQQRQAELMARWRAARDSGIVLPPDDQAELNSLNETEVRAAGERAAAVLKELAQ